MRAYVDVAFIRVNCQPLKQGLGTWVTKWIHTYSSFLRDFVARRLTWLHSVLDTVDTVLVTDGLGEHSGAAHRQRLLEMIGVIQRIRRLQDVVSAMFPPLVDTVQLLKKHGHSMNVRTRAPRALQRRHGLHL